MTIYDLNKEWNVQIDGFGEYIADVPCSMYSVLLDNKAIDDPYYRDNEDYCLTLSNNNCTFSKTFTK